MRPLRLVMKAFGPYADVVELDFGCLAGRTLFLIHGPTGAGKTTILDAICFALFGEAAGSDRRSKDARSHFADAALVTEVTLEFALGEARWRVTRSAEHARPGGVTMRPPQASLERLGADGGAELRASRVRDVDAAVCALLGFEAEQFRQVVLLPQGEFRRLLVSDSKDREKILETLFGAALYRRIEAELRRAGSALEAEVLEGRTRIDALLGGAGAASVEELDARGRLMEARHAELDEAAKSERARADSAARDLAGAEKTAALFAEAEAAGRESQRLAGEEALWLARRGELAAARRAQALEGLTERVANARSSLERETRRQEAAAEALARAESDATNAARQLVVEEGRDADRRDAETLTRRLRDAGKASSRLAALRQNIAAAEARRVDASGAVALNGRDLAYAQGRVDAADKELALLGSVAADIDRRRVRVADARRLLEAAGQMEATRSFLLRQSVEVGGARQRFAEQEAVVARAQAAEADLHRRWSEGQAALLARELADGQPCPVCGSTEHPRPALAEHDVPTQRDVESARAAIDAARADLEVRRRELDRERAKEDALRSKASGLQGALGSGAEGSAVDAAGALARAEAELVEAGKAHARTFDLGKERHAHLEAIAEAEADLARAGARIVEEEKNLARDRALAEEVEKVLPADLAGRDVAGLLAQAEQREAELAKAFEVAKSRAAAAHAARTAAAAAAGGADSARREADAALAQAVAGLDAALSESGFASADALGKARRKAAEIDALEGALRRFDEALASARARADRAEAATRGLEPGDLDALRKAAGGARSAVEALLGERSRVEEALATTRRTLASLGESALRIGDAEKRYLAVGRVADVAGGANADGVSFARFVLGTLLDDVLAAATERLLRMSQGRFALVRAGERRDRRRSGGLDLEVFDAHTGVARPAATLSGGESFLASLSLALGLADVVQSHTGGIHLETMFIDEGFGTLDPEALDLAMQALEDLQAGGRLVGMISHVSELKERVAARLEVASGRHGSTARFVC